MNTLLGTKRIQSQGFLEDGTRIPITSIAVFGNTVIYVKQKDKHGYAAIQLGLGIKKHASRALLGHAKGAVKNAAPRFLREVSITGDVPIIGDVLKATDIFRPGDVIQVTGTSKGKGYAGVVKRYHFKGGPRTHGQSDRERAPGSIGQTTTPGRVYRGKRMSGRMGDERVTVKNLRIVDVSDTELLVLGLVPGVRDNLVIVTKVGEDKKFVPLYKEERKEEVQEEVLEEVKAENSEQKAKNEPQVRNETEGHVKEIQASNGGQPQQPIQISTDDQTKKSEGKEEEKKNAS